MQLPPTIVDNYRILGSLGERKQNTQTAAYFSVPLLKIQFYSYLVQNIQKATLNFHLKSRFSVKPGKLLYFAHA